MKALARDMLPTTENFTVKRRYLTEREVERLIEAAKSNRHGHRDATWFWSPIVMAYGLRRFAASNGIRSRNCSNRNDLTAMGQ